MGLVVHGIPATVLVAGDFAGPSNVQWLNEGIKALQIPVVFPAAASLQIMMSITIQQMTLMFTEATAWNPACSTTNTLASFQFPFAFPLDITSELYRAMYGPVFTLVMSRYRCQNDSC